jgi:fused signal recognition particle receptor
VLVADTAGRLHTKTNLMEELRKVRRVLARQLPEAAWESLLVLDATTGQNALAQARQFQEVAAATGVVLAKLDTSAKGGMVLSIGRHLGLPVKLVGTGEGPEDLEPFDPESFLEALLPDA